MAVLSVTTATFQREVLQSELSAAVSGVRPVEVALTRAQRLADRIMGRA